MLRKNLLRKLWFPSNDHRLMFAVFFGLILGCSSATDTPEIKLERARMLMERNQAAEAIPILNEVVAAVPQDEEARYQRGVAYESLDVLEKALIDYTECLVLNSERTDALNNKAVVLAKLERFKDAAAEFTRLVDLDPQGAMAYRNRGLCHFDLGEFDTALADYAKALELDPKDPANWFQRASVYLKQKRFEEAEQDYSKAIEIDPSLARAWMNRGVARYKRGELNLAAEDFDKAQSLDENIIMPDIDIFPDRRSFAESSPADGSEAWKMGLAIAEKELASRGFTSLKRIREIPSFGCAEYSAKFEGNNWRVLVADLAADSTTITLPSSVSAEQDPANNITANTALIVISQNDAGTDHIVSRFEQPWNPASATAEPLILRYKLEPVLSP